MDRLIGLFEQDTELLCPLLAILFPGSLQFAEMVGIAQGVKPAVVKIRFPVIVTKNPCETGQNPDSLYGLTAPFFMGSEMAQARAGNIVQPAAFAADIDSCLVDMEQAFLPQRLLDP